MSLSRNPMGRQVQRQLLRTAHTVRYSLLSVIAIYQSVNFTPPKPLKILSKAIVSPRFRADFGEFSARQRPMRTLNAPRTRPERTHPRPKNAILPRPFEIGHRLFTLHRH